MIQVKEQNLRHRTEKEIILSPGQTWVSVLDPKDIIEKEPSQEKCR